MRREKLFFVKGIGVGIIVTATLFYSATLLIVPDRPLVMSDEEIIREARELGMGYYDDFSEDIQDKVVNESEEDNKVE